MATDDDDAATLRERVRDLEATVAQQQDTIEQLMPSRRAILAGGAGLVGGAALTGQASAQSAAGQVGTSSEPVDVEAATVTATDVNTDSVSTKEATIGGNDILVEDPNSPFNDSGTTATLNLSDSYDFVEMRVQELTADSQQDIEFQINGVTSSSYQTFLASSNESGSSWILGEADEFSLGRASGTVQIYSQSARSVFIGGVISGRTSDPVIGGHLNGSGVPISQITIISSDNVSFEIEVVGR